MRELILELEWLLADERKHQEKRNQLWFALGQKARVQRENEKLSLREMARRMKISAPSLSDLELGRRHWTRDRMRKFIDIIEGTEFKDG